jgi:hypothetical protein
MDELAVVMKAREFIAQCGPSALPVAVEAYARQVGGGIKYEPLQANEDAWSVRLPNGKLKICVNKDQKPRRQRFSVCHEVAHAVLGIEPDHTSPGWSYSRRPPGEIACDAFAAELLLPYKLFKPRVDASDLGFAAIRDLAEEFDASLMATGSRFATFSSDPCAFLLSEGGKVRYCARSASLREARAWIAPGSPLPAGSLSAQVRAGGGQSGPDDADPDDWFTNWDRDGSLREDVRHFPKWDQTLTFLWFDDEDLPLPPADAKKWDEDLNGMRELDGNLPWPGRKKRR